MWKHLQEQWDRFESIVGLFGTFFVGFAPPVLLLLFGLASLTNEENAREAPAWVLLPAALVTAIPAVWIARLSSRTLYSIYPELRKFDQTQQKGWTPFDSPETGERVKLPMPVVMPTHLANLPLVLGIPLSMWWLLHFGSGVLIGFGADRWMDSAFPNADVVTRFLAPQALNFAFSFASNIYLMLAIGVHAPRLTTLQAIWRWRIVLDIILTLVTFIPAAIEWASG